MRSIDEIKDDLAVLGIDISQKITKEYVKAKFRKLAKLTHPDKKGGNTEHFQVLHNAFKKIIKFIEETSEDEDLDFETEFFMKNNFMKECTASYVVYIQDNLVDNWRKVLERHLGIHKVDNIKVIFKNGDITITLYKKPKKDPRSKLHIQSKDQARNLDFILESLSKFYGEVCKVQNTAANSAIEYKDLARSICIKCGKNFINKKGLKQHVIRMHSSKRQTKAGIKIVI